tara:strand:+ start:2732 stop:2911 length:180 start_codon:yes stop_codon:yes gene_type:complete
MGVARVTITIIFLSLFSGMLYLVFTQTIDGTSRDVLFLVAGGMLSSLQNILDYWFKKEE